MFNLNRSQNGENSNEKNIRSEWLKFSSASKKDSMLENLSKDNKFIVDEIKLRSVVVEMLEKEFGENIKNIKGYDYLVDSVVNKLKKNQLEQLPSIEIEQ